MRTSLRAAAVLAAAVAAGVGTLAANRPLRARLFAAVCTSMVDMGSEAMREVRCEALRGVRGAVVEIGPGPGANFGCFDAGAVESWTGVEPNPNFGEEAVRARAAAEGATGYVPRLVRGTAEDMAAVGDATADFVVSTHVLCSVPAAEVAGVLREVERVLKPGGQFVFLEHVAAREGTLKAAAQRAVSPLWRIVGDGCEFRHTGRDLDRGPPGLRFEYRSIEAPIGLALVTPHIVGRATKVSVRAPADPTSTTTAPP